MNVTISINCDNAAFETERRGAVCGSELARILFDLAQRFDGGGVTTADSRKLYDINGNTVGEVIVRGFYK